MSTYSNNPKQTIWEMWFVTSIILVLGTIFIGTVKGSIQLFPNYHIWMLIVFVNFVVCLYEGLKQR